MKLAAKAANLGEESVEQSCYCGASASGDDQPTNQTPAFFTQRFVGDVDGRKSRVSQNLPDVCFRVAITTLRPKLITPGTILGFIALDGKDQSAFGL